MLVALSSRKQATQYTFQKTPDFSDVIYAGDIQFGSSKIGKFSGNILLQNYLVESKYDELI
jgi:hypothetical protein